MRWVMGMAFCAAMVMPRAAEAGFFFLQHSQDAFDTIGPQTTPITYDFAYQNTLHGPTGNFGEVHATVNAGAIGINAYTQNFGAFAPQGQEVAASYQFEVIFSSATSSPIDVILNLQLGGTVNPGFGNAGGIDVFANILFVGGGSGSFFENPQAGLLQRTGMLASFSDDGTQQSISTPVIANVPVNVAVTVTMQLNTRLNWAQGVQSSVEFGNTYNLNTAGDVFTILGPNAEDISVNSVGPDEGVVVDNRFGQTADVPEPSSMALLGIGALGLLGVRRRSRRLADDRI